MAEVRLGPLAALPDKGATGFVVAADGYPERLLVVRYGGRIFAYRNSCPHRRLPLDYDDGRFLTTDGTLIRCSNHGALFRIEDGVCLAGPCVGTALSRLEVRMDSDELVVAL